MKTRCLVGVAAAVAIIAVAVINVSTSQNKDVKYADLVLANVEALANGGESGVTIKCCLAVWGVCENNVLAPYVECTWK